MTSKQEAINLALQKHINPSDLERITIQDGTALSEDVIEKHLSSNKPLLFVNADDNFKKVLFRHLGIKGGAGCACYLLVLPIIQPSGRKFYHILESGEQHPLPPTIQDSEVADSFARALSSIYANPTPTSERDNKGPEKPWWYSYSYTIHASPNPNMHDDYTDVARKHDNYTPPEQNLTAFVTYEIQAYLEDSAIGQFQWVYVNTTGFLQTNNMAYNDHDHRGWGNGAVKVSFRTPMQYEVADNGGVFNQEPLAFYQCSPPNTNNSKEVTSSVNFEVGYKTTNFNVSESQTEIINDWEVILTSVNSWTYRQSDPFDGDRNTFSKDDMTKYDGKDVRHEIKSWPELTKTVFNWVTMSVWHTETVAKYISIVATIDFQVNFIHIKNDWPGFYGSYWYYTVPAPQSFELDMSLLV